MLDITDKMTDAPQLLEATCATCTWSNNQHEQQVCVKTQMHNQAGFRFSRTLVAVMEECFADETVQ